MVTEADREAELSKVIAELRALLIAATPGDLSTAARHTENETVECPACQGDGEIEAADYCNFDGAALGVQFYGIGREFGAHEKLWTAMINALPMLLDAADSARHRTASTAALTAEIQRLREDMGWFSGQRRLSLEHYSPMYGDDDDQSVEWRVHRESGSVNDREWEIVGRGETALAAIQSARTALSTPSEVSEPNPDEVAGTYSAFEVSEPVADAKAESDKIGGWVHRRMKEAATRSLHEPVADHIGGEGETPEPFGYWVEQKHAEPFGVLLRKPAYIPEPSPLRTVTPLYATTPNTNGDAVREALEGATRFIKRISLSGIAEPTGENWRQWKTEARALIADLAATLAKHGGAEA